MTEDETVGWHHRLDGHEFEQVPGVGDGQGDLVCCSPWGHKGSDRTEVNLKVKNCAQNKELVYFRPRAQLLACRTSVGFPWGLCDWHCWGWGPVNTGRGGSTEALNKRHREPALSNSYIKQTNQPLLATHRPNLFTRTLKVFSDGLGLFVC